MKELNYSVLPKDPNLAESFDVFMVNEFSLPSFAVKFLREHGDSFKAQEDDIYVVSHPKTGTTWVQEIVSLICSDLDFQSANSRSLHEKFPYIEHSTCNFNAVKMQTSSRLMKTHFPYSLLPDDIINKKCKMIYVSRNPKDVVVSYYHFACWLKETAYQGTFDQFFERFIKNRTTYGPFLLHNLQFWQHRDDENILFLFYENLKEKPDENVKKIAEFLGKTISDDEAKRVAEFCSFKNMSDRHTTLFNESKNFFRKGKSGNWKDVFSAEQSLKMDKWIEESLQGSDLQFQYE